MIYELLYKRPICVVPAVNFYKHRPHYNRQDQGNIKYPVYRYEWAGEHQRLPLDEHWHDSSPPSRDGSLRSIDLKWKTDDLSEEEKQLTMVGQELPDTKINDEYRSNIANRNYVDRNGKPWIRREQMIQVAGFFGIKALRSCRQFYEEGTEVLYGSNVFQFRSETHDGYSLEASHDHIPTMPNSEGVTPTPDVVLEDVNRIFKKIHQPRIIWEDEMLRFFNTIGPSNAAWLKSIKLSGTFKDEERPRQTWRHYPYPGYHDEPRKLFYHMQEYLPVYSSVLKNVCKALETVYLDGTVNIADERDEDNDGEGDEVPMGHQILNASIGTFVEDLLSLPKLKKFHLGWSGNIHGQGELTWTFSEWEKQAQRGYDGLKWVKVIDERPPPAAEVQEAVDEHLEVPAVFQQAADEQSDAPAETTEAEDDEAKMPKGIIKSRKFRGHLTSAVSPEGEDD